MLEPTSGSSSSEKVLVFLLARKEECATEIARFFATTYIPFKNSLPYSKPAVFS